MQVDLDLGNYERFLDLTLRKDNNITTGKIYQVRHCPCHASLGRTFHKPIVLPSLGIRGAEKETGGQFYSRRDMARCCRKSFCRERQNFQAT